MCSTQPSQILFTLTSQALHEPTARKLMDALDDVLIPAASAVSMNEVDETDRLWQVTAYYEDRPDQSSVVTLLKSLELPTDSITIAALPDEDWVARSLDGLAPVRAGRFVVYGSHHDAPSGGIPIRIDAGTAFGTGHHPTTTGCLLALDSILGLRKPGAILDVGCGSGVLAIAAARAARRLAIASDIDPEAVRVTCANAGSNGVGLLVRAVVASGTHDRAIAASSPFDLIFANILARPLIGLANEILKLSASGADIVLSGLTQTQASWVLSAYRNRGAILRRNIRLNGWSTLWLRAPSRHQGKKEAPGGEGVPGASMSTL